MCSALGNTGSIIWKSISHTTNMTQTSYIQRPMYMTPLILKLKLSEKSDFRL